MILICAFEHSAHGNYTQFIFNNLFFEMELIGTGITART